jgi:nucleoside-diphosphate kinase
MEKTLVLIKPDGIERNLIGHIVTIYEEKGFNIIALKMVRATREIAEDHYEEHIGRVYFNELVDYIIEERLVAMILEGENVIEMVRRANGDKDPLKSEMGSIRGEYCNSKTRNLVHASDSYEHAQREIKIWFPEL